MKPAVAIRISMLPRVFFGFSLLDDGEVFALHLLGEPLWTLQCSSGEVAQTQFSCCSIVCRRCAQSLTGDGKEGLCLIALTPFSPQHACRLQSDAMQHTPGLHPGWLALRVELRDQVRRCKKTTAVDKPRAGLHCKTGSNHQMYLASLALDNFTRSSHV
jgi:hypothetical protein